MRATDLAQVCRAAGLAVTEVSGWQTRARTADGGQYLPGRPDYVMCHHTASSTSATNDVAYICAGATYAPLANLYLARDGRVYVCAAGPTNTNGKGGPLEGVALDDMNRHALGVEAANNGTGEPWPTAQTDAYVRLVAALLDRYRLPTIRARAHHEWAPGRKIDPAGPSPWAGGAHPWNMDGFRRSVDRVRADTPTIPPQPRPPDEEDEMTLYACVDQSGTVWVGDGVRRRTVANPDEFNLIALRGQTGAGPRVLLACGNGTPANMGNVGSCRMTAAQLESLGAR